MQLTEPDADEHKIMIYRSNMYVWFYADQT
jgi:hypothetical protein